MLTHPSKYSVSRSYLPVGSGEYELTQVDQFQTVYICQCNYEQST